MFFGSKAGCLNPPIALNTPPPPPPPAYEPAYLEGSLQFASGTVMSFLLFFKLLLKCAGYIKSLGWMDICSPYEKMNTHLKSN